MIPNGMLPGRLGLLLVYAPLGSFEVDGIWYGGPDDPEQVIQPMITIKDDHHCGPVCLPHWGGDDRGGEVTGS